MKTSLSTALIKAFMSLACLLTIVFSGTISADERIVQSTNELYSLLDSMSMKEFSPKVYYHGAQLFEQTSRYDLAIKWFRLATLKGSEYRSDAAWGSVPLDRRPCRSYPLTGLSGCASGLGSRRQSAR